MKVQIGETTTYIISNISDLDPVYVYVTNYKPGQGKIVIECFGEAWGHYWPAMGEDKSIQEFILNSNNDYLARKLARKDTQIDYDEINDVAHKRGYFDLCVTNDAEIAWQSELMERCFGDDYLMELPRCNTPEYVYLCKILNAIKSAFTQEKCALKNCHNSALKT